MSSKMLKSSTDLKNYKIPYKFATTQTTVQLSLHTYSLSNYLYKKISNLVAPHKIVSNFLNPFFGAFDLGYFKGLLFHRV